MSTMGPVHLEQLYAEELSLFSASSGLKGRFAWRPVADARDTTGAMLLSNPDECSMVGILWAIIDSDCTLQYEVNYFQCILISDELRRARRYNRRMLNRLFYLVLILKTGFSSYTSRTRRF